MADFFIRRPIVAMVIAILTVIVGTITLKRLPISEYPPVSPTMIQVTTTYRGAAAEAVMESVATPIESKVNGVDKLLYLQSFNANDGKLTLNVYFDVGTDVDIMQVNTQNRVGQAEAQLPDAVKKEGVVVNRSSPDILMVVALASPKGTYDAVFLGNYCDINLVDAIKRVRGVGDVKNFTAQDYTMRIWLRPDRLASLGITPQDIQNAIKEQNAQSPAGRIGAEPAPRGQQSQFNVRAQGLLKEPKEFGEIIIRSNPDGSQVKIKDVARVELGARPTICGPASTSRPRAPSASSSPPAPTRSKRPKTSAKSSRRRSCGFRRTWNTTSRSTPPSRSRPRWRRSCTRCWRRWSWCCWWSTSSCRVSGRRSFRCARCRCRCWARSSCFPCSGSV